jgi:Spy/CpxP family protein refolding chaperone
MTRRTIVLSTLLLLALGAVAVLAQVSAPGEMKTARGLLASERQTLVGKNLGLTPEEAQKFWPLYLQYRGEMMRIGDRAIYLLETMTKSADAMDDATAQGILKEYIFLRQQEWDLKSRWRSKFERAIPPAKVLRFFQIENTIDSTVASEIAGVTPLVLPAK